MKRERRSMRKQILVGSKLLKKVDQLQSKEEALHFTSAPAAVVRSSRNTHVFKKGTEEGTKGKQRRNKAHKGKRKK